MGIKIAVKWAYILLLCLCFNLTAGPENLRTKQNYDQLKTSTETIASYDTINQLRKDNKLDEAETLAHKHLEKYPKNVDVILILGFISYQKKNYPLAASYFEKVLADTPTYLDAKLGLIRTKVAQKKFEEAKLLLHEVKKDYPENQQVNSVQTFYDRAIQDTQRKSKALQNKERGISENVQTGKKILAGATHNLTLINKQIANGNFYKALAMINQRLCRTPKDPVLLHAKVKVFFALRIYAQSAYVSKKNLAYTPSYKLSRGLLNEIKAIRPHELCGLNEIGLSSYNQYVSDLHQIWDFSSLYLSRTTPFGNLIAQLNYAARLGEKAPQTEVRFLPIINPNIYLELYANYANKPELFPNYAFSGEVFATIANYFTLSLGEYKAYITNDTTYRKYTASLSKEIGKYWLNFRTNHYIPNTGERSTLYLGTIRKYFTNYDTYINLTVGTGHSPDLSDLQTLDFLVIKNRFVNLRVQFPIYQNRVLVDLGTDYQNWNYPNGLIRKLYGLNVGLNYRF